MILGKLLRNRGLGLNLVAGCCFILLLVNGWGLRWSEILNYLWVLLVLLGGVIGLAALCGWLLHCLKGVGKEADVEVTVDDQSFNEAQQQQKLKNNNMGAVVKKKD